MYVTDTRPRPSVPYRTDRPAPRAAPPAPQTKGAISAARRRSSSRALEGTRRVAERIRERASSASAQAQRGGRRNVASEIRNAKYTTARSPERLRQIARAPNPAITRTQASRHPIAPYHLPTPYSHMPIRSSNVTAYYETVVIDGKRKRERATSCTSTRNLTYYNIHGRASESALRVRPCACRRPRTPEKRAPPSRISPPTPTPRHRPIRGHRDTRARWHEQTRLPRLATEWTPPESAAARLARWPRAARRLPPGP